MGEDFEQGKCRDQFPFDRELGQKRNLKLVYGLARSVVFFWEAEL